MIEKTHISTVNTLVHRAVDPSSLSFRLHLLCGDVFLSNRFAQFIGTEKAQIDYYSFMQFVPREEYNILHSFHQALLMLSSHSDNSKFQCRFLLAHTLFIKAGKRIRLLRELQLIEDQHGESSKAVFHNTCVDVTNIYDAKDVHFDLQVAGKNRSKKAALMKYFHPVIKKKTGLFSDRELEILRAWKATDTIDKAANQLNISVRTLETHLRNMRKKVNVKRSVDVLIYAQDRGWV